MTYDLAGLGNALMDALVVVEDDTVLDRLGLERGTTHMVDHDGWESAYDAVRQLKVTFDSGGSCANTVATVGLLGGRALFCGQVGRDQMGRMYGARLQDSCGGHALVWTEGLATGKCLSIISASDAQRTMVTDLGAAVALDRLGDFAGALTESRIGHFEGYMLMGPESRALVLEGMRRVREAGGLVSLDVSDPHVVGAVPDTVRQVVRDHVDVVFLNADEAATLTGRPAREAVHVVAEELGVHTTIVKLGREGSLVLQDGTLHPIEIEPVRAVDTTGAGDAYAGGFLYGLARGWDPDRCGALASAVAALTVSQIGAVVKDRVALEEVLERVTA
jgi:sugar/nucleoside kinase (ribokinase family)